MKKVILWNHYNDTPNRRIFLGNLTGKEHRVVIKTSNPLAPGVEYGMKERTINYPLEEPCIVELQIDDDWGMSFDMRGSDVSLTITIAERDV